MRLHQTEAAEGPVFSIWPTVSTNKMKNEEQKTEMILNYALEIIYMLTGEKYTIGKKTSRLRKNNIHLVTEEVPIKCDDVAVFFSKEEWEYLQQHKELYQEVIKANKQAFSHFGFLAHTTSGTIPTQMSRNIGIPKITLLTPQSRHSIIKRTRLRFPKSVQFTQLVHSITNLGRRVAKIDRNIYHILKQLKRNSATYDRQYHEGWDCEKLGVPNHFKEDEVMLGDCQDPEYQPSQTTLPISSFGSFSCSHDVIEPECKMCVQTPLIDSPPLNSPTLTVHSEVSEHSQTHSPCTADSTGETLPDTPATAVSTVLYTSSKTSLNTVATEAQPDKTSNPSRTSEKKQAHLNNTNAKDCPGEAETPPYGSGTLRTTARLPHMSNSSSTNSSTVKCPAFIIVSTVAEDQQPQLESLRTPDSVGDPLPDIPLASMSAGLLNNFKMQSRGQPHRYAQLLFQHHVPYSLYKTWTHNTNYDGSRGKHALPKNLKRLIINETSMAFKMTTPVLKKIKDTLNGLLRIPRTGGWDSNSNFV